MSKRRTSEDGAAVVEFALVFPIFIVIVMGIIQYGWYFFNAESTNSAAREVARRVVVGDCWDSRTDGPQLRPSQTTDIGSSVPIRRP